MNPFVHAAQCNFHFDKPQKNEIYSLNVANWIKSKMRTSKGHRPTNGNFKGINRGPHGRLAIAYLCVLNVVTLTK